MLYLVMHVEYFEDEDRLGLVKGVKLSPFYEHIEVYSYGDSKFLLAPGENRHFEPGENSQFQPGGNHQSVPGGCSQPRFGCGF